MKQAKHVMNIILSCERFTKLQTLVDSLDDIYPEFATDKEYLNKRALVYSDFLRSEYEALTGMSFDELNPLEHTEEID